MGVVEQCGLGELIKHKGEKSLDELKDDCLSSNKVLIGSLQESEFSNDLMAQAMADAKLGRMSTPVKGKLWCGCVVNRVCSLLCSVQLQ